MNDREKFEAWMLTNPAETRMAGWDGAVALAVWQASRKQALEEGLDVCSKLGDREENIGRHSEAFGCDLCVHALACLANPEGEQG